MPRRVCSRADEALRDEFKLAGWVTKLPARRSVYFAWCDYASRELARLTDRADPKDDSVVLVLIAALGEDASFAGHVRRRRGSAFLTEDDNWDRLYRAIARTILEEYLGAIEDGKWP